VPRVEGVPLGPARRGRDQGRTTDLVERARGAGAQLVQVRVQVRDVRLLGVDLGLDLGSAQGEPFVGVRPGRRRCAPDSAL
jgi:hypothetical protein